MKEENVISALKKQVESQGQLIEKMIALQAETTALLRDVISSQKTQSDNVSTIAQWIATQQK